MARRAGGDTAQTPPTKHQRHLRELAELGDDPSAVMVYLTTHSNLPGPRGNLELAAAFADWASDEVVDSLADSEDEYLNFCHVLALGERLSHVDDPALLKRLHEHARDPRWRVREAVATGLQRVGDRDLTRLVGIVQTWAEDPDPLVQRAAAAAICEPRLLNDELGAAAARQVCDTTTRLLAARPLTDRKDPDVRVLRQALGYCWSVAVAADPDPGLAAFAVWQQSADPDVGWIVRENLKKARLKRILTPS